MMNDKKSRGRRRGFTLIEVLIALAILGIGILGVAILFPAALRESQRASRATVAAIYADSVVDVLRARGYRALEAITQPGEHVLRIVTQADFVYRLYDQPDVSVIYLVAAASDLYATVVVEVPFPDGRSEKYVTYIARQ